MALRDDGRKENNKALEQSTSRLLATLEQKCQRTDGVFDQKLADYVFFPLSQILQRKKQHTDRLSELTIRCVGILLEYGWRTIDLDLGKQLLILLSFVAGGVPGKPVTAPEEVLIAAYRGLRSLFQDLRLTPGGSASVVDQGTLPALGHSITVVLDGVTEGPSPEVQLQALEALDAAWRCIKDAEALASFLPGTISALTKCLMPTTASRRTKKTLIRALGVLRNVLATVLGDIRTRNIRNQNKPSSEVLSNGPSKTALTSAWLKATTAQIKMALSNVIRLRRHESEEVKTALNEVCLTLLDECHETLIESAPILVETSMTLDGGHPRKTLSDRKTSLTDLALIYPDIKDHVKGTVYNWVTSLPRIMQANDESAKCAALDQLSNAHSLLLGLDMESSILEDSLANSLRDSITVTLGSSPAPNLVQEAAFNLSSLAAMTLVTDNALTTQFRPIIIGEESQKQVLSNFISLLGNIGTRNSRISLARDMLDYVRVASGPSLLAAYWLSSRLLQSLAEKNRELDEFFESSLTLSDGEDAMNEELFSYSLSIITDPEEETDWRVQAIALEVIANTARSKKQDFRTELIDVLYPVTELLGSPNSQLREHAITGLNIISHSCGYKNASDLIVSNADYMVNAISLRLNTFDISPSAPQVLVMMIRLTGPSLLLYLDDVVGSIFAALDNFHGYHLLVESLFSVLSEIVSVGSKSDQLVLPSTESTPSHLKTAPPPPTIESILALLKPQSNSTQPSKAHEDFPTTPWKSAKTLLDESALPDDELTEEEKQSLEPAPLPPTKTYTMLQSITRLSQHYLTSSSPHLRTKLLHLITTSCASLALANDPSFLPLINDIWPVVITRLHDSETFVQIAAAETLSTLCFSAGDFLSTRIQSEWVSLRRFAHTAKSNAAREKGGRGKHSQAYKVWEAVIKLLTSVVGNVRVEEGMFDDALEVLGYQVLRDDKGVREVMEGVNADAVWLALWLGADQEGERVDRPVLEGYEFLDVASSSGGGGEKEVMVQ